MTLAVSILCSLLAAFQVVGGTVSERPGAETRVRGINFFLETASGLEDEASLGTHRGIGYTYGETASDPSRQYNGRVFDPGTGFHDYGARMYWPQIGRFISPDSYPGDVANPASLNLYSYVHNNPYKYTDPTGHAVVARPSLAAMWAARTAPQLAAVSVDESRWGVTRALAAVAGVALSAITPENEGKTEFVLSVGMMAMSAAPKGPIAGGGSAVENIPAAEATRIQNAANRIGKPINVVGSRAAGTARPDSDWDFVIEANSKTRSSVSSSLPGAKNVSEGLPRNQDVFKGPLDTSKPHVTFSPEQ